MSSSIPKGFASCPLDTFSECWCLGEIGVFASVLRSGNGSLGVIRSRAGLLQRDVLSSFMQLSGSPVVCSTMHSPPRAIRAQTTAPLSHPRTALYLPHASIASCITSGVRSGSTGQAAARYGRAGCSRSLPSR